MTEAPQEPATHIRSLHPYAFQRGTWAKILTVAPSEERDCYVIEFPDGQTDYWVVGDKDANYEFKDRSWLR